MKQEDLYSFRHDFILGNKNTSFELPGQKKNKTKQHANMLKCTMKITVT